METEFRPKSIAMQEMEHRLGRDLDEVLRDLYHGEGLTQREVGARLGIDSSTVARWMRERGIRARREGRPAKAVA
jgi:transposase